MIVYHYTTKESFDTITRTKQIIPSSPWTTMDSAYGTGWYFTELGPEYCDVCIAKMCWNNVTVLDRVTHYLKFDINYTILKPCRTHVYMLQEWKEELIKYLGGGEKNSLRCQDHRGF